MFSFDEDRRHPLDPGNARQQWRKTVLAVVLGLMLLVPAGWGMYQWFSAHPVSVWDFHPRWLGVRLMLTQGANPYGQTVTEAIQRQMYGRLAYAGEDEIAFAYPLPVMVLVAPFALLPLPLAQAGWMSLVLACSLGFLFLAPRVVGWRPRPWLLALTTLFGLGLYTNVWAVMLGQISVVISLLLIVVLRCWQRQRWVWAGITLALSTVKPQMAFLVVLYLVIEAILNRKWRFLAVFGASLAVLCLLPALWLPDWPLQWLDASRRYVGYTPFQPPLLVVTGSQVATATLGMLLFAWALVCRLRSAPSAKEATFLWAFCLVLVVNVLVAPRTSQTNQLVLLLPLFFLFGRARHSWQILLVELVLVIGMWSIATMWVHPTIDAQHAMIEHRLISPILPLTLTLGLLAMSPCLPWNRRESGR